MNRLFASFACLTLFTAAAAAQALNDSDRPAAPALQTLRSDNGRDLLVTCGPLSSPGALILLGSFDGSMASLGKGLPSILANSAVIAMTFTPGDEIVIATRWPAMHVLLQAVEVSFDPFLVAASKVVQVGDKAISADMVVAARQLRDDAIQASGAGKGRPADN